jgi:hypothetical protein
MAPAADSMGDTTCSSCDSGTSIRVRAWHDCPQLVNALSRPAGTDFGK